jgi:hypothetical protein
MFCHGHERVPSNDSQILYSVSSNSFDLRSGSYTSILTSITVMVSRRPFTPPTVS